MSITYSKIDSSSEMEYSNKMTMVNNPTNAKKFELTIDEEKNLPFPMNQYIKYDKYLWYINEEENKLCHVYTKSKKRKKNPLIFKPLMVNTLVVDDNVKNDDDDDEEGENVYKYIYGAIRSQIQLPQIIEINEILIPIGLEFVKFPIALNNIMLSFQIYNSYFYIDQLFTFFYDSLKLPIGLPIFDITGQRLLGFVGERSNNGYYAISGYPLKSTRLKLNPNIEPIINIQNEETIENKIVYGNMIGSDITLDLISNIESNQLETLNLENSSIHRINIVLLKNGKIVINATNHANETHAKELWAMKFSNSSKITYLLPNIQP
jgi:hypothetical protein